MVFEFALGERLHQNTYILILHGNVLKQHNVSLNTISEMGVPDVNMLGPVMEY